MMDLKNASVAVIGTEFPWVEACALAAGQYAHSCDTKHDDYHKWSGRKTVLGPFIGGDRITNGKQLSSVCGGRMSIWGTLGRSFSFVTAPLQAFLALILHHVISCQLQELGVLPRSSTVRSRASIPRYRLSYHQRCELTGGITIRSGVVVVVLVVKSIPPYRPYHC